MKRFQPRHQPRPESPFGARRIDRMLKREADDTHRVLMAALFVESQGRVRNEGYARETRYRHTETARANDPKDAR